MNFINLRDLVDGGGAGRSGAEFEGGGILSMIANLIAKPLGSQQGQAQPQGLLGGMGSQGQAIPPVAPPSPVELQYSGRGDVGMPQPPTLQYGGRGDVGMPMQYSGRGDAGMPAAPLQYGGRGSVGMPLPPGLSPEEQAIIEYLRGTGNM